MQPGGRERQSADGGLCLYGGQGGGPGVSGAHSLPVNLKPKSGFKAQAGRAGSLEWSAFQVTHSFYEGNRMVGRPGSLSSWAAGHTVI